jgi:hypothetical protein
MGGLARTEARAEYRQFVTFANMQKLNKFLSTLITSVGIYVFLIMHLIS